ncbi:penicillin-binding transpeptidase domain-containing protein [Nocardia jinanensis]|uniref:Penicillin-binding protein n=1 Tax=Nocardia jinanensis TaxID=382504 RepID=A0A917VN39_9NOCA|nr:penicillin-binding transpeptidase domain-containing protein [Nocardia jinanensis]GGL01755.1 penicillin-binding protein [Nocardia jinanensis]
MRTDRKLVVLLTALGLALAGCSSEPPEPDTVADRFTEALDSDDIGAAAALTDDPARARDTLGSLYDGLGREATFEVADVRDDTFTLDVTWKFGPDGRREWKYTTTGTAGETADGWKVHWNPATVAPGLDTGPLSYAPVYPQPARVLDAAGGELMTEQVVTLVQLAPGADTAEAAGLLATFAPGITTASLDADLTAAQGKPVTAISLREADIAPIRDALSATRGVTLAPQTRLLTTDKAMSAPTLSGLSELWQQQADDAAGWAVRAQTADGTTRIAGADPRPTADIRSTIDVGLQRAAKTALDPITTPAAIVAIRPSTGAILAVGQNAAADTEGPIALTGLYPPGSTFKTVTAAAVLDAGRATPDTVLPCPGVADIEGRRIPNDDSFDLGQVPLHTAFARSCNTTMAGLAVGLPPEALKNTAERLGLGVDYVTPGLTTVTGSVPVARTPAERVEASIGQGQVTASPFGMALVAASVAHGSTPAPVVAGGSPGRPDRTPPPLPASVTGDLKTMMRETISAGTATQLADIPGLLGKTGTAEYGDNSKAHGWFIGIQDDLAFAVFIADAGSSGPAVDAAGRMLRAPR